MRKQLKFEPIFAVLIAFLAVQFVIYLFTVHNDSAWLAGDRASNRVAAIQAFMQAFRQPETDWASIVSIGPAGDYLPFALLLLAFGKAGLIALQVLLAAGIIYLFYARTVPLLNNQRLALLGAALMATSMAFIYLPNVLATEMLYNSLLIMGFFRLVPQDGRSLPTQKNIALAMLIFGMAIFIRNQFILYPALLAFIYLWINGGKSAVRTLPIFTLAYIPMVMWTLFSVGAVGSRIDKDSNHDLGTNLYDRAERLGAQSEEKLLEFRQINQSRNLTVVQFLDIALDSPVEVSKTIVVDGLHLVLNPGTNSFYGRFLGIFQPNEDKRYWRNLLDDQGVNAFFTQFIRQNTLFTTTTLVSALVLVFIWVFAVKGLYVLFRQHGVCWYTVLLTSFIIYTAMVSFAVGSVRWEFRTQFEFALILLAMHGLSKAENTHFGVDR